MGTPPTPVTPSGNIANALNDIFEGAQNSANNTISDLIGAAADVAGGLGAIAQVVLGWINAGKPDEIQAATSAILDRMQADFAQLDKEIAGLNAENIAFQILQRNTILQGYISPAETQLKQLTGPGGFISSNPTPTEIVTYIGVCITALNNLSGPDDLVWNMPSGSWIYWRDVGSYMGTCQYLVKGFGFHVVTVDTGYGQQAPPQTADGTVFIPVNSLPLYLYSLCIFVAVAGALDPNFASDINANVLRSAINTLQSKHDLIMTNGLTTLSPPNWTSNGIQDCACPPPFGVHPGLRVIYASPTPPPRVVVGALIEYGAVEKFSGSSSIGDNYRLSIQSPSDMSNPAIFNKLQVRLLKRTKDVYRMVGLSAVWNVINTLKRLLGDPPLPGPNFADWSFHQLLSLSQLAPGPNGHSLRALAAFLIGTQPFDTPYSPGASSFSFRDLLVNFPD